MKCFEFLVGENTQRGRGAVFHHWFFYRLRGTPTAAKKVQNLEDPQLAVVKDVVSAYLLKTDLQKNLATK